MCNREKREIIKQIVSKRPKLSESRPVLAPARLFPLPQSSLFFRIADTYSSETLSRRMIMNKGKDSTSKLSLRYPGQQPLWRARPAGHGSASLNLMGEGMHGRPWPRPRAGVTGRWHSHQVLTEARRTQNGHDDFPPLRRDFPSLPYLSGTAGELQYFGVTQAGHGLPALFEWTGTQCCRLIMSDRHYLQ